MPCYRFLASLGHIQLYLNISSLGVKLEASDLCGISVIFGMIAL